MSAVVLSIRNAPTGQVSPSLRRACLTVLRGQPGRLRTESAIFNAQHYSSLQNRRPAPLLRQDLPPGFSVPLTMAYLTREMLSDATLFCCTCRNTTKILCFYVLKRSTALFFVHVHETTVKGKSQMWASIQLRMGKDFHCERSEAISPLSI